jgi:hypothetical protein
VEDAALGPWPWSLSEVAVVVAVAAAFAAALVGGWLSGNRRWK